jgi:hypothetical protein
MATAKSPNYRNTQTSAARQPPLPVKGEAPNADNVLHSRRVFRLTKMLPECSGGAKKSSAKHADNAKAQQYVPNFTVLSHV